MRCILAGGVGLAVVAGGSCRRNEGSLPLPAVAAYPGLPAAFAQELRNRQEQAVKSPHAPEAIRTLANLYHANRLYEEAQACYNLMARDRVSFTARDHYRQADIARNRNDLERAQIELRAVLEMEPNYLPARLALAEVLLKSGQDDAAAQEYAGVAAAEPEQLQAGLGLARIELQQGQEGAAVARLEELMTAHPESTSVAGLLAQLLRRRGEVDRAVALVELSQQKPDPLPDDPWLAEMVTDLYDTRLLGLQAEDCFRTGQTDAARSLLERIEKLDPASPVPFLLRGQAEALAHRDGAAAAQYQLALEKGADPEKICPELARSLIALGRVGEAATLLAEYHAKLPGSLPIAKIFADVLVQQGDTQNARSLLAVVLQKEPYARAQNMSLAQILWTAGERDAAVECLQRVATAHADDIPSRALLGEYFLGKSDARAAIPPLERAWGLAVPKTAVHNRLTELLAVAYLGAGRKETTAGNLLEAADYFTRATKIAPDNPNSYAALATVAVSLKQYSQAANALERLAVLQPENPTILLSWGDVLSRQGEAGPARQRWERALQLVAPNDVTLREALEARLRGEPNWNSSP